MNDGIGRLQELIDGLAQPREFASFRGALEGPLASTLAHVDVAGSCATLLEVLAAEPRSLGPRPVASVPASLVNASGSIRLELPAADEKTGTLFGSAAHRLMGVVSGNVRVKQWRHEGEWDPSVFAPDLSLSALPDRTCGPGETIAGEAWHDVVELSGNAVVLVLRSAPCYPVFWQYDRASLRPKGLIAATEHLARVEEALHILMRLGSVEDAGPCRVLARHESHAIRWAAVRAACHVGASFGYELLEAARQDPHPEVRRSAVNALNAAGTAQALQ